jgi:hypothetical protein
MIEETESPTGWGIAYKGIEIAVCRADRNKMVCSLETGNEKKEFIGSELDLKDLNARVLPYPPSSVIAVSKEGTMACWLDRGMISCIPEKDVELVRKGWKV